MDNEKLQGLYRDGYDFKLSEYINGGFNTMFKQPGLFLGYLCITILIGLGTTMLSFIGSIISMVIHFPLQMGYAFGADKVKRDEPTTINDFFKGFQKLGPFVLLSILVFLVILAISLPAIIYIIVAMFSFIKEAGFLNGHSDNFAYSYFKDQEHAREFVMLFMKHFVVFFLLLIPVFIASVSYVFAPYFVYFKDLQPWDAMEASRKIVWKKLGMFILFVILLGLINVAGAICLFVGLLVTVPSTAIATYMAFDDIVGAREETVIGTDNNMDHFIVG